jgi:hypothetical protein
VVVDQDQEGGNRNRTINLIKTSNRVDNCVFVFVQSLCLCYASVCAMFVFVLYLSDLYYTICVVLEANE